MKEVQRQLGLHSSGIHNDSWLLFINISGQIVGPTFRGQRGPRIFGLVERRQNAECLPKSPDSVSLDFC
jgi:hypothetical protein